jgi:EcsC protein family
VGIQNIGTQNVGVQSVAAPLPRAHYRALARAVNTLESSNFAARLADYAGAPVNRVVQLLPRRASRGLSRAVEAAIHKSLKTAIGSLDPVPAPPATWMSTAIAGLTGGVSGFFGMAGLVVELPLTTTIMLRAIADIARHNGEDLRTLEARLACLQVFALGSRSSAAVRADLGYFAARALMTRLSGNAAAFVVERGAAELSGVMLNSLVAEIVSRFSIVVSDRVAASALPVVGAVGGATVNVIFMNHFQQVAQGHFTIRRLEREYGAETVRVHYAELVARSAQARK